MGKIRRFREAGYCLGGFMIHNYISNKSVGISYMALLLIFLKLLLGLGTG